jgi:hypothetical protein
MAKNQYFTKDYVSQALMHQHNMVVSNKSIKLVLNFNGIDYALVQKADEDGYLVVHQFIIYDVFWHSDNARYVNPITLKELVKPSNK